MTSRPRHHRLGSHGFTLIEVIITLVMLGLLAAMLMTAIGTSVTSSNLPVTRLQQTMALQQTMENIRALFVFSNDISLVKIRVGDPDTGAQSNGLGDYEVIENAFITFDTPTSYSEAPGTAGDGVLKVSIRDLNSGLTLTELFVQW